MAGIAFSNVCAQVFPVELGAGLGCFGAAGTGCQARRDINIDLHCIGPLLGQPLPGVSKTNAQTTDLQ